MGQTPIGQLLCSSVPKERAGLVLKGHDDTVSALALQPIEWQQLQLNGDGSSSIVFADGSVQPVDPPRTHVRNWMKPVDGRRGQYWSQPPSRETEIVRRWPQQHHIISASYDSTIRTWRPAECSFSALLPDAHTAPVRGVAVHPEQGWFVTGSEDWTARVWSRGPTEQCRVTQVLEGHTGVVKAVAIHPDGRIVTGSWDRVVGVWTREGELTRTMEHASAVNAVTLFTTSRKEELRIRFRLIDTDRSGDLDGMELRRVFGSMADSEAFISMVDKEGVFGSTDQLIDEEEFVEGIMGNTEHLSHLQFQVQWLDVMMNNIAQHCGVPTHMCAQLLPMLLAVGCSDNSVCVWRDDGATGANSGAVCIRTFVGLTGSVYAVAMHRWWLDNQYFPFIGVVSGGQDGTLRMWDVSANRPVWNALLPLGANAVWAIQVSETDHWICTSCDNGVHIWSPEGLVQRCIRGHADSVKTVALKTIFDQNGRPIGDQIISGSIDKTIRMWDLDSNNKSCRVSARPTDMQCTVKTINCITPHTGKNPEMMEYH